MIQRNHPGGETYYEGARDALHEYQGAIDTGSAENWTRSYTQALAELNEIAAEAAANAAIVKSSNELEKI